MRAPYCLAQTMSVLYVAPEITNSRIENVVQRVFPKEQVTYYTHALRILIVEPQSSQICYRVYSFFYLCHLTIEIFKGYICRLAYLCYYIFILFYEGNNSLPIVFWNIFCLVLQLFIVYLLLPLLFLTVFIFRDSFELGYDPRFLVKIIAVSDLWKNGRMINLNNGGLLLLFFIYLVEDAIIFLQLLIERKYVFYFNLAQSITLFLVIVIWVDLKVEHR